MKINEGIVDTIFSWTAIVIMIIAFSNCTINRDKEWEKTNRLKLQLEVDKCNQGNK